MKSISFFYLKPAPGCGSCARKKNYCIHLYRMEKFSQAEKANMTANKFCVSLELSSSADSQIFGIRKKNNNIGMVMQTSCYNEISIG